MGGLTRGIIHLGFAFSLLLLAACSGTPTAAPISLAPGQFTLFGVNPKSPNPGPSDVAGLQAAQAGTLGQPAFVEFYSDMCLICASIKGTVSDLEQQFKGKVDFIRINVDAPDSQASLKQFNVRGTPTIVLLDRRGGVAANVPGWSGDQAVEAALTQLAAEP